MRKFFIIGIIIIGTGIFYRPLHELVHIAFGNPLYSHALLIPFVSMYIFWVDRKSIFSEMAYSPYGGAVLMAMALAVFIFHKIRLDHLSRTDSLSVLISCLIVWISGGFLLVCGRQAFKKALFPLLFLAFMIPLPSPMLDPVVTFLQSGSAWSSKVILQLFAVPIHSHGVFISLPGVTIEVAKECSGIRSALSLVVLCTFAGYLYLGSNRSRCIFVLSAIPIAIAKNGMRIATLSLLGTYVDIHYLTDSVLHSYGGKPFFLVAILMLAPIFWVLKRSEIKAGEKPDPAATKSPLGKNLEASNDIQIVS